MPCIANDVERGAANGVGEPAAESQRKIRIARTPDHRGGNADIAEACAERLRLLRIERGEMSKECLAPLVAVEWTLILVDRMSCARRIVVAALEIGANDGQEPVRRKAPHERHERARDANVACWPAVERHAVHQRQLRDAIGPVERERLRDAAAKIVTDDARARDAERVEQSDDALGVRAKRQRARARRITATVAEQVDDDDAMAGGHLRDDVAPEVAGGGKAVKKDDRLARAACAGRVVVEPRTANIDELTAHERADDRRAGARRMRARCGCAPRQAGRKGVTTLSAVTPSANQQLPSRGQIAGGFAIASMRAFMSAVFLS